MSKPIEITGKRNIDKMFNNDGPAIRSSNIADKVDETWLEHPIQINIINKLYLNLDFDNADIIKKDLNKKLAGYKSQDQKKGLFNEGLFIDQFIRQDVCFGFKISTSTYFGEKMVEFEYHQQLEIYEVY